MGRRTKRKGIRGGGVKCLASFYISWIDSLTGYYKIIPFCYIYSIDVNNNKYLMRKDIWIYLFINI